MCQASLAFSLMALGVKKVSATLPALEVVFFRSLLGTLMIGALILRKRVSFFGKPNQRKMLFLRGFSGFIALSLHFYTLSLLPLGTAVMLNYTGPFFVALLATIFLKEKLTPFLTAMILVSFSGVYLLVEPRFQGSASQMPAILLALLSAVFAAVVALCIRWVRHRESPLTIIFYFTAISTIGSLIYLPFGFDWPNGKKGLWILLIAVGSFYGQLWMTISYRRAPASLVSPFAYLTPLLSFFYGMIFWKQALTLHQLAGIFLIILGGTLVCIVENRRKRQTMVTV